MALIPPEPATIADWLAFDDGTDTLYELVCGRLIPMAWPTPRRGAIAARTSIIVGDAVGGVSPCRPVINAGISVEVDGDERGYIVDIALTCEEPGEQQVLTAPRLLVEILLSSTEGYDKRRKVSDYARLPSAEEIWLVDSRERSVLVWQRVEGTWIGSFRYSGSDTFQSRTLGVAVALDRLYHNTGLWL